MSENKVPIILVFISSERPSVVEGKKQIADDGTPFAGTEDARYRDRYAGGELRKLIRKELKDVLLVSPRSHRNPGDDLNPGGQGRTAAQGTGTRCAYSAGAGRAAIGGLVANPGFRATDAVLAARLSRDATNPAPRRKASSPRAGAMSIASTPSCRRTRSDCTSRSTPAPNPRRRCWRAFNPGWGEAGQPAVRIAPATLDASAPAVKIPAANPLWMVNVALTDD